MTEMQNQACWVVISMGAEEPRAMCMLADKGDALRIIDTLQSSGHHRVLLQHMARPTEQEMSDYLGEMQVELAKRQTSKEDMC